VPGMTAPLLARGGAPGLYRGWTGAVHFFADPASGVTACGVSVRPGPWPDDWGEPKPEKKTGCRPCSIAYRLALICPSCLHGADGHEVVRWRGPGRVIEDPGGEPRAILTDDPAPALWTCYGGCEPAHEVAAGTRLAILLDSVPTMSPGPTPRPGTGTQR
jgi:hypothetical protein